MNRLLIASTLIAFLLPFSLSVVLDRTLHRQVEPGLSAALGQPVKIRSAEVGLSGTISLTHVRVGNSLSADELQAAMGLSRLGRLELGADEITVVRPSISAVLGADGTLDLGVRTPQAVPHPGHHEGDPGLRRILVEGGDLLLVLPDGGEIRARDIDLHPEAGGVRVVTGAIVAHARAGAFDIDATFTRAGLDLSLPRVRVDRAALDGGHMTVHSEGHPAIALDQVTLIRGADNDVQLQGHLAGHGVTDTIEATLERQPQRTHFAATVSNLPLETFAPIFPAWAIAAGSASGKLDANLDRVDDRLDVTLAVAVDGVQLSHPVLASQPLPIVAHIDGSASWSFGQHAGRGHARAEFGKLVVEADLELAFAPDGAPVHAALTATAPRVACADAVAALPAPVRVLLDGLDVSGNIGGKVDLAVDRDRPDDAELEVKLDNECTVLRDADVARIGDLNGPYKHTLPDGTTRVLAASDARFVALAALPPHVPAAFVAAEDSEFYRHHGFDVDQLRRSLAIDVSAGRVERGGSTIPQQLIKNLYLTRDRTLARKLLEAVLTWRLEQLIRKKRILEAYLNVVELGIGVYGIEPAAERWFGKRAELLDPAQAAFLAALTSAPTSTEHRIRARRAIDPTTVEHADVVLRSLRLGRAGYTAARAELEHLPLALGLDSPEPAPSPATP